MIFSLLPGDFSPTSRKALTAGGLRFSAETQALPLLSGTGSRTSDMVSRPGKKQQDRESLSPRGRTPEGRRRKKRRSALLQEGLLNGKDDGLQDAGFWNSSWIGTGSY
jgi:hypothetical protein